MLKSNVKLTLYITVFAVASMLMSCGTKGPLYIPEQRYPQKVEQSTSQDSPAPEQKRTPPPLPTVKDY